MCGEGQHLAPLAWVAVEIEDQGENDGIKHAALAVAPRTAAAKPLLHRRWKIPRRDHGVREIKPVL